MNSQKSTGPDPKTGVRRRQKGERRIAQIVDAAERVLVERGYEAANTNLIAAEADISPGSLYQFFRNKDEIYQELATRYASIFATALDHAFLASIADLPVEALVDRIVDTLIGVNVAHPGLRSVFRGWDAPPGLAAAIRPLQQGIVARAVVIVAQRIPQAGTERHLLVATVTTEIFRSLAPLVLLSPPDERDLYKKELKRVLTSYICAVERAENAG